MGMARQLEEDKSPLTGTIMKKYEKQMGLFRSVKIKDNVT